MNQVNDPRDDSTPPFVEPFPLAPHQRSGTPPWLEPIEILTPKLDALMPDDSELPPIAHMRPVVMVDRELVHESCDHIFNLLDNGGTPAQQVAADQFAHRHGRTLTKIQDDAGS